MRVAVLRLQADPCFGSVVATGRQNDARLKLDGPN
jgi:hypothetical protein